MSTERIRVIVPTSRIVVRIPGAQGIQGEPAEAAPVTSVAGRTGAVVLAKADVGLSAVDNTADANKPVSALQAAADAAVGVAANAYTDAQILAALVSAIKSRGGIDCSASPNYPAATANDLYYVTHAGKIGGVAGPDVEIGDTLICVATAAAGDHATVGASWVIVQANMPGLTTVGTNLATLATPAGPRFLRINDDGTVSVLTAADFKTALALAKADVGLSAVDNTADADKPVSTAQAAAIAAAVAPGLFNEQIGTTYTLALTDAGKTVRCTNAGPIALTVPANADVAFAIGQTLEVCQGGAGKMTISGAVGVTIECPATERRTTAQHAGATLKKRAENTWWLEGRLE